MLCLFNKKFSINGKAVMIEQSHVRFKTTLDGSESRCASVVATGNTMNWWGVRTKSTIRQPFVFSPIVTTGNDLFHHFPRPASSCLLDSDDLLESMHNPELGTIKVAVYPVTREARVQKRVHSYANFQPVGAVHERSKKAGVHCVRCVLSATYL